MRTITTDVDALERYLGQKARDFGRPRVGGITTAELEILEERYGALAHRVAQLLEIDLHEQNDDVAHLATHSYGYAIQHKSRERFLKLLLPDGASGEQDRTRAASDAELLARLDRLGLGQQTDSVSEVRAITAGSGPESMPATPERPADDRP